MPKIFRILNLTPDSFSDGNRSILDSTNSIDKVKTLINKDTYAIDVGAESTRPGADPITEEEEWSRLRDFLQQYDFATPLSLDSRNASTIAKALELNPKLMFINDVSGLQNQAILKTLADFCGYGLKYIAMHSCGMPPMKANEIRDDYYKDHGGLEEHMLRFFARTIKLMQSYRLDIKNLILDPGLGFGKNLKHSFEIIQVIPKLKKEFGLQILLGPSRKSFLKLWKNNPEASIEELDQYTSEFCELIGDRVEYLRLHLST